MALELLARVESSQFLNVCGSTVGGSCESVSARSVANSVHIVDVFVVESIWTYGGTALSLVSGL